MTHAEDVSRRGGLFMEIAWFICSTSSGIINIIVQRQRNINTKEKGEFNEGYRLKMYKTMWFFDGSIFNNFTYISNKLSGGI